MSFCPSATEPVSRGVIAASAWMKGNLTGRQDVTRALLFC